MASQLIQKLQMVRRWGKILAGTTAVAVEQGPGRAWELDRIAGYYNDLTGKVGENTLLDGDGIPLTVTASGEQVHFPIAVFQYGLGCYDLHLLGEDGDEGAQARLGAALACTDWAIGAQRADGSWDAFGPIGSAKYTVSSMAQGEGASLLLRAHAATGKERYREAALRAVDFMLTDLAEGGTAVREGEQLFLEEYPQEPRRGVLNGWVFSLFGLYDAALVEPHYREPFERSVTTLAAHLGDYDRGYWSNYDLEPRIASPAYHSLHVAQLRALAELTDCDEFAQAAGRFEGYAARRPCMLRAVCVKVVQKLTETSDAVIVQ